MRQFTQFELQIKEVFMKLGNFLFGKEYWEGSERSLFKPMKTFTLNNWIDYVKLIIIYAIGLLALKKAFSEALNNINKKINKKEEVEDKKEDPVIISEPKFDSDEEDIYI